jgi:hypothetical protein
MDGWIKTCEVQQEVEGDHATPPEIRRRVLLLKSQLAPPALVFSIC